ncbi:hypothetical protein B0H34DRAFT_784086 [Crassisporium funariophilum]|nr:hypothetical protein B0H34DRAFT_784086 [Crassisporium funariophilum]
MADNPTIADINWEELFQETNTENLFQDRDYDGIQPESSDDDSEHSDNLIPELSDSDSEDDEPIHPAIQIARTASLRERHDPRDPHELSRKVEYILRIMDTIGINLPIFLDALSWGDEACTQNAKVRYECAALMNSQELAKILRQWLRPERSPGSKRKRPRGAAPTMKAFALECIKNLVDKELRELAPYLASPAGEDVEPETLLSTGFAGMQKDVEARAPLCLRLLKKMAHRKGQEDNTNKGPEKVILTIISMLSYARSHHSCRLQKLLAIYLKFRGISAKGFDTLHAMALTMSHKWTANVVSRISKHCMDKVRAAMDNHAWVLSDDNVTLPFKVFSQRLDNKSEFGNSTAATVYIKPDAKPLSEQTNRDLKKCHAEGLKNPLTELDIINLSLESYPRIMTHTEYRVLRFLLDAPAFDLKTYKGSNSSALQAPPPVDQLPSGPDHITLQYLLGTVNIPEASYEDHECLIDEWFGQLGWNNTGEKMKLAMQKVVAWVGDQLTVDRLRGLFKFRADDENSFERLDFMVLVFGWLHLQMAFANSLHKQYLGTERGRGLRSAFNILERKGLTKVMVAGPFHHDLEEALYHVAEAHLREDWLLVGDVENLAELRKRSPEELARLASEIVRHHASSEALDDMDMAANTGAPMDEQKRQVIMWNRDVLQYIVLDQAIRTGDVGLMEDFLPTLFLRFVGGGNGNYSNEVLELLQGLHREWPEEVSDFVRHHCWVMNFSGKPMDWCAVDKAQEHNIKDIKVTYRSEGPNIKWKYLKKLHPAIHVIRAVTRHIETEFGTLTRGMKHTIPKKEKDLGRLHTSYCKAGYHKQCMTGRTIRKKDKAEDYILNGIEKLQTGTVLAKWIHVRRFERSKSERWGLGEESSESGSVVSG